VGAGGAGGTGFFGGGGGAGAIIFFPDFKFVKKNQYSISVGFGGNASTPTSSNSIISQNSKKIFEAIAGGNGGVWGSCTAEDAKGKVGGSGGGGGNCMDANPSGTDLQGGPPSFGNIVNEKTNISLGFKGGKGYGKKDEWWQMAGGGGGAGSQGTDAVLYSLSYGGDGIHSVNYKGSLSTLRALYGTAYTNVASLESDNRYWIGGGGGGGGRCGGQANVPGGKGGGGTALRSCDWGKTCSVATPGKTNTGSGGGGQGQGCYETAFGGSGLVLIRYKIQQPTCHECDKGTYSNVNSSSKSNCKTCSQGFFANQTGSSTCSLCPSGTITTTASGFVNCVPVIETV